MDRSPRAVEPFTRFPDVYFDHLAWLKGARLAVLLTILRQTKYADEWVGWTIGTIGRMAQISPSAAQRALAELAQPGRVPPRGHQLGHVYVEVSWSRSVEIPNALTVLRPPVPVIQRRMFEEREQGWITTIS